MSLSTSRPFLTNTPSQVSVADANHPCAGLPTPKHWKHIVVLMFENQTYNNVIGHASYSTKLAQECATATAWMDANTKVNGVQDGHYNSSPITPR